jgi:hypothetical protein
MLHPAAQVLDQRPHHDQLAHILPLPVTPLAQPILVLQHQPVHQAPEKAVVTTNAVVVVVETIVAL